MSSEDEDASLAALDAPFDANDPHGDGYGSDLMGDRADRDALAAMTELERETVMAERSERRRAIESRRKIMEMASRAKRGDGARAVSGKREREMTALGRIAEARARRERRRRVFGEDDEDDEESGGEGDEMGVMDGEYSDDVEERDVVGRRATREKERAEEEYDYASSSRPATKQEIESITIRRHQLESWITEPYFESAITGCLCRVGIGLNKRQENVYRLVEIAGVAVGKYKQYSLKSYVYLEGKPATNVWLILKWGNSEKTFRISEVSNSAVQDAEWAAWVAHCRDSSCQPVTSRDVTKCLENLKSAQNYRYTSDDVTKILAQKREKLGGVRHNLLFEKEQIRAAIAHAEAENDVETLAELRNRYEEVDKEVKEKLSSRSGATQDALANINRKNEIQNSEKLSKRASEQVARLKKGLGATGEGDPFSRRPTRLTTYWDMGTKAAEASKAEAEATKVEDDADEAPPTDANVADEDEHDDLFITAGNSTAQSEKELLDVLQQAHRDTTITIDLSRLDAPAQADALRLKTTRSVLERGAALLRSSYDAIRAEHLATAPRGRAFSVQEYLAEFA